MSNVEIDIAAVINEFSACTREKPPYQMTRDFINRAERVFDYALECQANNDDFKELRKGLDNVLLGIPDDPVIWVEDR